MIEYVWYYRDLRLEDSDEEIFFIKEEDMEYFLEDEVFKSFC